jgi:hypothetical protein
MGLLTNESRYANSDTVTDPSGRLMLSEREPFRFRESDDNIYLRIGEGMTWWDIAERLYAHVSDRACGLYWALLDYQITPVVDPTLQVRPGTVIVAPSPQVLVTEILAQDLEVFL